MGDFDNDGYDDADFSATGEGAVHIQYGSSYGAYGPRNNLFPSELNTTIGGAFGASLVTGDMNGDGYDDLAVGVPNHDAYLDIGQAGGVMVIYGSANGLERNTQFIFQYYRDVPGDSEKYDLFGSALAMDDFNRDGYADLAIGIPR